MVWLSEGKELRPSDHGVPNEAEASGTAQSNSAQMLSFFGGGLCSSTEPRPEATNFTAPSWSGRRVGHGDHVKKALIVSIRKKKSIAEASGQMRTLAPWKQEVRDEEGRRRFHGAFSGGFSAGYYNTVGSKEGWTPQTFTSSRKNRAEIKQQDLTELKLSNTFSHFQNNLIVELFVKEDVVMFEDKCDATSTR